MSLTKYNNYHCYSNIPQLLSAEVVLCTHKTTILCQFGLIFVTSLLTHISINSQPFLVGIVSLPNGCLHNHMALVLCVVE